MMKEYVCKHCGIKFERSNRSHKYTYCSFKCYCDTPKNRKSKYNFNKEEVIRLHYSGKTTKEIGLMYNCPPEAVCSFFKRNHLKTLHLFSDSTMPKLTVAEGAYLAGIIDGEGHIGKDKRTNLWRITVVNTNFDVIKWMNKTIPHSPYTFEESKNPKHSDRWSWKLSRQYSIYQLLNQILPYLIIKVIPANSALKEIGDRFTSIPHLSDSV